MTDENEVRAAGAAGVPGPEGVSLVRAALALQARAARHGLRASLAVALDLVAWSAGRVSRVGGRRSSVQTPNTLEYDARVAWAVRRVTALAPRESDRPPAPPVVPVAVLRELLPDDAPDADPRARTIARRAEAALADEASVARLHAAWCEDRTVHPTPSWLRKDVETGQAADRGSPTERPATLDPVGVWPAALLAQFESVAARPDEADAAAAKTANPPSTWNPTAARSADPVEWFDHAAAAFYAAADDPELFPDQVRRVRRLRARRRPQLDLTVRTPTDQHPYAGAIPLSVLIREPEEEFVHAVVNRESHRLNDDEATRPRRVVRVHVAWVAGWASGSGWHERVKVRPPLIRTPGLAGGTDFAHTAGVRVPHASGVRALVGLILDDWRSTVRGLPVEFRLNRRWPGETRLLRRDNVSGLQPGRRWRQYPAWSDTPAHLARRGAMPAEVAGQLFARRSLAEAARAGEAGEVPSLDPHSGDRRPATRWVCGVCHEDDLPDLGVRPVSAGVPAVAWEGQAPPGGRRHWGLSWLGQLHHLIVVRQGTPDQPADAADGVVVQVRAETTGNRRVTGVALTACPPQRRIEPESALSCLPLRSHAIDVLLEQLDVRL
jgi:hypothetical protein